MKYKIELDIPENKLALALEFLKNLTFVKAVKAISTNEPEEEIARKKERPFGLLKGTIRVPEDFNEPLDDLKDYM